MSFLDYHSLLHRDIIGYQLNASLRIRLSFHCQKLMQSSQVACLTIRYVFFHANIFCENYPVTVVPFSQVYPASSVCLQ